MQIMKAITPTENDLALINELTQTQLTAEQVYLFSVKLCDNEIDRDIECFENQTLQDIANKIVGVSGILDHNWSAENQNSRCYKAEYLETDTFNSLGNKYAYVKIYAYALKGVDDTLIAKIEGGINKEVSIGCQCSDMACSICGQHYFKGNCPHKKGLDYEADGETKSCYCTLSNLTDVYEWSFVAVPAQRMAGVTKSYFAKNESKKTVESQKNEPKKEAGSLEKQKLLALYKLKKKKGEMYNG